MTKVSALGALRPNASGMQHDGARREALRTKQPDTSDDTALREAALQALRDVIDPEVGLDVVSLGLVYAVTAARGELVVELTMTTPACPLGDQIVQDAERRIAALRGVGAVRVELVWDPPWTPDRMSPEARQMLGWNR